jgi:hypothetical protein
MDDGEHYSVLGDEVMIRISVNDYDRLLLMAGFAIGGAFRMEDTQFAYRFVDLVNRINKGNPLFRPYEIPEQAKITGEITPEAIAGAIRFFEETIERLRELAPKPSEGEQTYHDHFGVAEGRVGSSRRDHSR